MLSFLLLPCSATIAASYFNTLDQNEKKNGCQFQKKIVMEKAAKDHTLLLLLRKEELAQICHPNTHEKWRLKRSFLLALVLFCFNMQKAKCLSELRCLWPKKGSGQTTVCSYIADFSVVQETMISTPNDLIIFKFSAGPPTVPQSWPKSRYTKLPIPQSFWNSITLPYKLCPRKHISRS